MWLINTTSLELEDFMGNPPLYAILSHRWGSAKEEVSFREWHEDHEKIRNRPGYVKIIKACEKAREHNLEYLWVDTNCIDKSSSAELSEAINSMWQYYSEARVCYTYLQDVNDSVPPDPNGSSPLDSEFCKSDWFTRGWTLQELLAPRRLVFYNVSWTEIGTKSELRGLISLVTGIDELYLKGHRWIHTASISCRMSWISNRVTTRVEDIAYCMLGIFDINMSLLYGERHRAFERLQEEIMKISNDQTIFAWNWLSADMGASGRHLTRRRAEYLTQLGWEVDGRWAKISRSVRSSMFAPDPILFYKGVFVRDPDSLESGKPYVMTHLGLSISLLIHCSRCFGYGHPSTPSLALVVPLYNDLPSHDPEKQWYHCLGFVVVTANRYNRRVERRIGGSLLSFKIPSYLIKQHFPPTDCFVPRASWRTLTAYESTGDLNVWRLETKDGPALDCVTPHHRGTNRTWVSVFSVAWGGKIIYVLVRASRMPHNDLEVRWDCRETEMVSQAPVGEKNWTFEGTKVSLDEIVTLSDGDSLEPGSNSPTWSSSLLSKCNDLGLEIRLEGEIMAVSNPRSRIRFLHAISLDDT